MKHPFFITEADILDWECCFNCVFAKKWRNEKYSCRILQLLKRQKRYTGRVTVFTQGKCSHLIKRPDYCAETYGSRAIIYNKQNNGVINLNNMNNWHENYMILLGMIRLKLNLTDLIAVNKNFSWSFTTSKKYILIRNKITESGNLRAIKYYCEHCRKKLYYKGMEIHHIRPRSQNGSHSTANLEILCKPCHKNETLKLFSQKDNRIKLNQIKYIINQ
jgi:hypothetical protein